MSGKHTNIALFVPHAGCPHQCSFCNQKSISGSVKPLEPAEIDRAVEVALAGSGKGMEIAFFGGSFTAIEQSYMRSLLERASKYIDNDRITGIRISTRPDAVDDEICKTLKFYGVTAAELGAQSMDDEVLRLNRRGHTAQDVARASELIKAAGISLGLQMMTGLYGGSREESLYTAQRLIELEPETMRIYPTVVLEGTPLGELYKAGKYVPQSLDEAVDLCAGLIPMFHSRGIKVIRLGLHSGGGVEEGYLAGPYHPSFRELCDGEIYFKNILELIKTTGVPKGRLELAAAPEYLSQLKGQKKKNIKRLEDLGYECTVSALPGLGRYEVRLN